CVPHALSPSPNLAAAARFGLGERAWGTQSRVRCRLQSICSSLSSHLTGRKPFPLGAIFRCVHRLTSSFASACAIDYSRSLTYHTPAQLTPRMTALGGGLTCQVIVRLQRRAGAPTNSPSGGRHVGTGFGAHRSHREARRRKTPPKALSRSHANFRIKD